MKKIFVLLLTAMLMFVVSSLTAWADSNTDTVKINVNGQLLHDLPAPVIVHSSTLVPIRALEYLGPYKVNWNSNEKTVTVTSGASSDILQFKVGDPTVYKNKMAMNINAAPMILKGTAYVPLRVISEGFGAFVDWDPIHKGIIILNPDRDAMQMVRSGDLAKARLGVVKLPRIDFHTSTEHPEFSSLGYIFNENSYSEYYFLVGESIYFYTLENGYVNLVWEGKQNFSKNPSETDPLSVYLGTGIDTLWGEQPKVTDRMIFFKDQIFVYGKGENGIVDTSGKVKVTHENAAKQLEDVIVSVPEEGQQ